ncbi:mitochondrial protein Pet127-domain-containing protein [Jimgerdemannia flammicorona]|nr:mitochondrial protein Pet127-domain-containing protein [Jimgerdemannia flammicorona]
MLALCRTHPVVRLLCLKPSIYSAPRVVSVFYRPLYTTDPNTIKANPAVSTPSPDGKRRAKKQPGVPKHTFQQNSAGLPSTSSTESLESTRTKKKRKKVAAAAKAEATAVKAATKAKADAEEEAAAVAEALMENRATNAPRVPSSLNYFLSSDPFAKSVDNESLEPKEGTGEKAAESMTKAPRAIEFPDWLQPQQSPPSFRKKSVKRPVSSLREKLMAVGNWKNIVTNELKYEKVLPPGETPPVPHLAHGLDRALFNPGVHYLQDPRSKVFNFDPYLKRITPPADFDYSALAPYITSSKDETLWSMAKDMGKRYVGSTSSTTSVLSHFYFVISGWKPVDLSPLSSAFKDEVLCRLHYINARTLQLTMDVDSINSDVYATTFNRASRAPASIFLRYKEGVYAIDVDKSYDVNETILSVLGKSMEKMLTLPPSEFERYRKENSAQLTEQEKNQPETYAYGQIGNFLLRSQLDCQDERLPNKIFDLKTRAVIPIRLDQQNYADYGGYQLKRSHGLFESFEREYYDMIRSAFLKYSFQARMGHMDGVFVAFHNTSRIFGFQYISLDEMDARLYGNSVMGEKAFATSIKLLNEVLNTATEKYPEKTLRLSFDTHYVMPRMNIFVEVVPDIHGEPQVPANEPSSTFFTTGTDKFEPFQTLAKYRLMAFSTVNGERSLEPVSLDPHGDDQWDVHYNCEEAEGSPQDIRNEFRKMRMRQAEYLSTPEHEYPLLKKVRTISKEGLQDEDEDEKDLVIYRPWEQ